MSSDLLDALREQGCSVNDVKECLMTSSPNVADAGGTTPAHLAAMRDNQPMMRALLEAGANIMAQNSTGDTPLHVAAACGQDRMVRLLLQQADKQAVTAAALTTVNSAGQTPLHRAAACAAAVSGFRAAASAKMLLAAGSDTGAKDSDRRTPQDLITRIELHQTFNNHKRQRNQQQQQSATNHTQDASGSHHSAGGADLASAEGGGRRTRSRRAQKTDGGDPVPTAAAAPLAAAAGEEQPAPAGQSATTAAPTAVTPTAHKQPAATPATPAAPAGSAATTPGAAAAAAAGEGEETPRRLTSAFTKAHALLRKLKQQKVSFAELAAAEQQLRTAAAAINALCGEQKDFWLSTTGESIELYHDSMAEHGDSDVWQQIVLQMLQSCNTV